jgi:hypothetical protein
MPCRDSDMRVRQRLVQLLVLGRRCISSEHRNNCRVFYIPLMIMSHWSTGFCNWALMLEIHAWVSPFTSIPPTATVLSLDFMPLTTSTSDLGHLSTYEN